MEFELGVYVMKPAPVKCELSVIAVGVSYKELPLF